ncbi:MAG: GHKL domain-containing protein [Chloroflexi bacterium]|nr:MAG: GHKL domain-containing protein [Chloroflexota bacterium]TMD00560.1 MAG: GHKL domain-containing protein [Chloroflexota bacterium]
MEYINTIGKSFVAAIDRFQVHRALLGALQKLYSFAACSILLKGDPFELSIIPCYPLSQVFIAAMIERIASAASVIDFPAVSVEELANASYLDAPDDLSITQKLGSPVQDMIGGAVIGSFLNVPLTVENRIVGMLSLFDEREGTFDTDLLKLTTMIADYAAVALENVRLRERETALWRQAEIGRQRLELIISSMAEGLLITNEQGGITLLNVSAQHLLAQAQLDLKQNTPLRKLALANNVSWLHKLADIIDEAQTGVTVMNQELIAGEAGESVPLTLSISAAPLHDASQVQMGPIGVVAVLNDVTSNKQIEKLKDEFVSVVSHELRSPLTAIKGYTQHLMRRIDRRLRKAQQEQQSSAISAGDLPENYDLRSLSIIQSQADHLERLVNDLLDLSQVQWGKLHLQYSSFYLADVLVESVRSVQASTEQHTIYLDIAVQDTKIVADKMRMSQVIGNILDNAIKYSPQGGQVTVKLEEREGDYFVSITDQGIGISQEYLDHIFERFYRVRNTASRQYSGIGLGLYVTRAIVEEHGGHIWVTNNKGLGCTFSFTVPAAAHSD